MKALLTAEQLDVKTKLIAEGEAKVSAKQEKMSKWQQSQEADLTAQYQKAMAKIEKEKTQVKYRKQKRVLALKAKESLADEIAYIQFLVDAKNERLSQKNNVTIKRL